jgi:hypothetical protein
MSMTQDQQRAEIVALACAHVAANCNWREANRLAIAQHAHLCELLATEQPEAKPLGKVYKDKLGLRLFVATGKVSLPRKGEWYDTSGLAFKATIDHPNPAPNRTILRELTPKEAEAYRKEQQQ